MTRSAIYAHAGALWQAMRAEYDLALEAHIAAAERATAGVLLARGSTAHPDALFRMNPTQAAAHASPELLEHWRTTPRPTLAAFEREWLLAYLNGDPTT